VTELRSKLEQTWSRGTFTFLVNNAGIGLHKSIAETTESEFDDMANVQMKGVFFLTQRLLPLIAEGGRIVNLSSCLVRYVASPAAIYAMTKGSIDVFTRYLAKELGPRNITVNVVAPGAIATDFNGGATRDDPKVGEMVAAVTALGRAGKADDVGPMIASLLSDDNHWVNGQRIEVSGGMAL